MCFLRVQQEHLTAEASPSAINEGRATVALISGSCGLSPAGLEQAKMFKPCMGQNGLSQAVQRSKATLAW